MRIEGGGRQAGRRPPFFTLGERSGKLCPSSNLPGIRTRVALAGAMCVAFMPIAFRIGPLTTMNGALPPVDADTPCSPYPVSHNARTTASTTGM